MRRRGRRKAPRPGPVSTKMPAPITAPMPRVMRLTAPSERLSVCSPSSHASCESIDMGLTRSSREINERSPPLRTRYFVRMGSTIDATRIAGRSALSDSGYRMAYRNHTTQNYRNLASSQCLVEAGWPEGCPDRGHLCRDSRQRCRILRRSCSDFGHRKNVTRWPQPIAETRLPDRVCERFLRKLPPRSHQRQIFHSTFSNMIPPTATRTASGPASLRRFLTPAVPIGALDVCLVVVAKTGPMEK